MILLKKLQNLDLIATAESIGVGQETLKDIIEDLLKPGRDLRDDFEAPVLRHDVLDVSDLKVDRNCKELFETSLILVLLLILVFMKMV